MKTLFKLFTIPFISLFIASSCSNDDNNSNPNSSVTSEQQKVFQEFWDIYDRHYPLFHRKNIDWQNIHDTYYPQITSSTTDNQLFSVFSTIMNNVIKDGHTDVVLNNNQEAIYEPPFNQEIENMIQNNTPNKVTLITSSTNNPYISYGTLVNNSNIGYIQSKQFEPINDDFDSELVSFKAIVDEALTALQNKSGIIVDVRTNGGGQGMFAFYLAGRFFSNSTPIQITRQRIKTTTGSSVSSLGDWATQEFIGYPDSRAEGGYVAGVFPQDNTITSSGNFQFTGKVALLTSNSTGSAAEYFTAAMKTQPHVKSIGDKTFGIFAGSDILTLTNGGGKWKTRVSTHDVEVLYNGSFQSFEGIGISPDEQILPTSSQISAGDDVHIIAAINYITN